MGVARHFNYDDVGDRCAQREVGQGTISRLGIQLDVGAINKENLVWGRR